MEREALPVCAESAGQQPDLEQAPAEAPDLAALAECVRQASAEGRVVRLNEVWPGTEDEFEAVTADAAEATDPDLSDLRLLREDGRAYLYSALCMTEQYAALAARSANGDVQRQVAETVRYDSSTYPRPTPVESFALSPFDLTPEQVRAAVAEMGRDPQYSDIGLVTASNGAGFLYSAAHLHPDLAQALAEWTAVGQYDNP